MSESNDTDEKTRREVMFLDFDGVIHRLGAVRTQHGIRSASPSITLFEFAPVLVELLEPHVRVEIVLSTSWVPALGFQRARDALPATLRNRVVGATYHSKFADADGWPTMERGRQVLRYVWTHRLTRWLAIDDDVKGFGDQLSHVVQCDESLGLGDIGTQDALRIRLAEQFG
ncbi:hydrolase [Paraburkholderia sprentiae WSM5005]|uniref:Hydrolase n=2 Tax=Paraburkholderia sprentiae TaxID=948107 RepID=A0A1I9YCQ1_9BURK|nr:hydrolase [Paraburkholderia sprentiae WSM5005]